MILCTPAFHKAYANGAHFGEFVDGFKAVIHRLGEQLGKFLVVEDFQRTAGWYFANRTRVKAMPIIADA